MAYLKMLFQDHFRSSASAEGSSVSKGPPENHCDPVDLKKVSSNHRMNQLSVAELGGRLTAVQRKGQVNMSRKMTRVNIPSASHGKVGTNQGSQPVSSVMFSIILLRKGDHRISFRIVGWVVTLISISVLVVPVHHHVRGLRQFLRRSRAYFKQSSLHRHSVRCIQHTHHVISSYLCRKTSPFPADIATAIGAKPLGTNRSALGRRLWGWRRANRRLGRSQGQATHSKGVQNFVLPHVRLNSFLLW